MFSVYIFSSTLECQIDGGGQITRGDGGGGEGGGGRLITQNLINGGGGRGANKFRWGGGPFLGKNTHFWHIFAHFW